MWVDNNEGKFTKNVVLENNKTQNQLCPVHTTQHNLEF